MKDEPARGFFSSFIPRPSSFGPVIATGYLANARRFGSYEDARYPWYLTYEDTIDNLGRAFLGLTIGCARCHDHKFDPVSQEDYYALYGFFSSTRYPRPGIELDKVQRDFVPLAPADEVHPRADEEADIRLEWLPLTEAVAGVMAGRLRNGILAMGVLASMAVTYKGPIDAIVSTPGSGDLATYSQIIDRMRAGEPYYDAAHKELVAGHYGGGRGAGRIAGRRRTEYSAGGGDRDPGARGA